MAELCRDISFKSIFTLFADSTDEIENAREDISSRRLSVTMPMALPLKRNSKKPMRRYEHYDEKGKDSKISKIFQLAVTALSFLAFGGYLLTLIITAIRRNMTNNTNGNVVILSVRHTCI